MYYEDAADIGGGCFWEQRHLLEFFKETDQVRVRKDQKKRCHFDALAELYDIPDGAFHYGHNKLGNAVLMKTTILIPWLIFKALPTYHKPQPCQTELAFKLLRDLMSLCTMGWSSAPQTTPLGARNWDGALLAEVPLRLPKTSET